MGSAASITSLSNTELTRYVCEVSDGKYAQYKDKFEASSDADAANLLKAEGEDEFSTILTTIGVDDEGTRKGLFQEFSMLKANMASAQISDSSLAIDTSLEAARNPLSSPAFKATPMQRKGATGQSIEDKASALRTKNKDAVDVLKAVHHEKMLSHNNRLKERLLKKQKKKVDDLVKGGMAEEDAKSNAEKEVIDANDALDKAAAVMAKHHDAIEIEDLAGDNVVLYEPLMGWLVDWLISLGADMNDEDNTGLSALMYACQGGKSSLVQLFISRGCDPNAVASDGSIPLHVAAQWGNAETVDLLLAAGALYNAVNADGWTPLLFAAIGGHVECVRHLVKVGADLDIADDDGFTALMYAMEGEHREVATVLQEAGAKVNAIPGFEGEAE